MAAAAAVKPVWWEAVLSMDKLEGGGMTNAWHNGVRLGLIAKEHGDHERNPSKTCGFKSAL